MTSVLQGIAYNIKGLKFGLKTPGLLMLGLVRFAVLVMITLAAVAIILAKYQQILNLMWVRPESAWVVWLWYLAAWALAFLLTTISTVVGFLIAQLLFSVIIMDYMSQITERKATGRLKTSPDMPVLRYFVILIKQEIPRAVVPIGISLVLLVLSWFTPLGPVITLVSPVVAAIFLAWDNTDLVPARRMTPFGRRFAFLRQHLGFHIGFGSLFLVPVINIVLLSFAPVGATLYHVEKIDNSGENRAFADTEAAPVS